eukprot:477849-Rhodomonas_salina.1
MGLEERGVAASIDLSGWVALLHPELSQQLVNARGLGELDRFRVPVPVILDPQVPSQRPVSLFRVLKALPDVGLELLGKSVIIVDQQAVINIRHQDQRLPLSKYNVHASLKLDVLHPEAPHF